MLSFKNKVVIITGCSSGIGLAITFLFLSRKARVFGIDMSPFKNDLDASQAASFTFHQVDLTMPNVAQEAVATCVTKYGAKIDVLANIAGIANTWTSADTVTEAVWARVMNINLTVPVLLMQAVLPHMKAHKSGAIVNISSIAGIAGARGGIAYTASKAGLIGATENVAWRFHEHGIRCNAICPGRKSICRIAMTQTGILTKCQVFRRTSRHRRNLRIGIKMRW